MFDDRYRNLAVALGVAAIVTTLASLTVPHGWPIPTVLAVVIAVTASAVVGWLASSMRVLVAAPLAVSVAIGAPYAAPIALTAIAVAATFVPDTRSPR